MVRHHLKTWVKIIHQLIFTFQTAGRSTLIQCFLTNKHTHKVLKTNIFEPALGCWSACQLEIRVNISSHKCLRSAEIHWRTPTQAGCSLWWLARTHQIFVHWTLPTTTLLKYAVIDTVACWRRWEILYKGLSNKRGSRFQGLKKKRIRIFFSDC